MNIHEDKYLWTKNLMPIVYELGSSLKHTNKHLVISLPLTWETLCLIDAIKNKINISVIPLSSGKNSSLQPQVFPYLKKWGVKYYKEANQKNRINALQPPPDIILDCVFKVSDLGFSKNLIPPETLIIEDTRTGYINLQNALGKYKFSNPYFVLDNSRFKQNYENRVGIGYSVVGSLQACGILLKGKTVTILGFGPVGQGLAEFCSGMGAKVNIVDIDLQRKKMAQKNYIVGDLQKFISSTDIFITATGCEGVIQGCDITKMKDGAILVNAGADFGEWDQEFLHNHSSIALTKYATQYLLKNGKGITELGGGNSFNLVSGVSISGFLDITFSLAVLVIKQYFETGVGSSGEVKIKSIYSKELEVQIKKHLY